jgi:hypothetical protein
LLQAVAGVIFLLLGALAWIWRSWIKAHYCTDHRATNFSAWAYLGQLLLPLAVLVLVILAIMSFGYAIQEFRRR